MELASYEPTQTKMLSQISFSSRMLSFSWSDFFYRKPALIKRATTKSKKIRNLKLLPKVAVVFILFSTSYFFYNLFYLNQLKKELKEVRYNSSIEKDEVVLKLVAKGKKVLQSKVLTELIKEEGIAPQVVFKNLDDWLGKNSWLVSLQTFSKEGQKQVKYNLYLQIQNFLNKNKQT